MRIGRFPPLKQTLLSENVRPRADLGGREAVGAVARLPLALRGAQRTHLQVRHGCRRQDCRHQGIHVQGTRAG